MRATGLAKGVETLKTIREACGWSMYRAAKEWGIPQTQYAYLERKARSLSTTLLVRTFDIAFKNLGWGERKVLALLRKDAVEVAKE